MTNRQPITQTLSSDELDRLRATDPPAVISEIHSRTGHTVSECSIYRTLSRLLAMNLIHRYRVTESRRQYTYEITALGAHCLEQESTCN